MAARRTSVEILGYLATSDTSDVLVGALADPDPPVRAAALRALARAGVSAALVDVTARLDDPDADVRCVAAETLGKLTRHSPNVARLLRPLLRDRDSAVQAQAAVVLLRIEPTAEAWDLLATMAAAGDPESRLVAFDALCELGNAAGFDVVAAGLTEAAPAIRRGAAAALARLDSGRALPLLVRALRDEDRLVREHVARALQPLGHAALETVAKSLFDPAAEDGALLALERLPAARAAPAIRDYAGAQATLALAYLDRWRGLTPVDEDAPGRLLADSLSQRTRRHATNALRAVGSIGDVSAMALILRNLASADPRQRANALETLDSFGERKIVRPLLAVWESVEVTSIARADLGRRIVQVLADDDSWLRACGAFAAGNSDDPEIHAALDQLATSDPDALVRDTAMAARRGGNSMAGHSTLSLMERVLFLRQVPLFADLAPSDLKQVAVVAAEEVFGDGEVLATQGEAADELFVIVSGSVKVLATGRAGQPLELARVGSGSYVGEMAILTGEPHMASLVAVGSLRVLTIGQKQFESILRDRPETSLAVIRVLCTRLRDAERPKSE